LLAADVEHEEIRWRAEAALERLDQHNAR